MFTQKKPNNRQAAVWWDNWNYSLVVIRALAVDKRTTISR